MSQILPPTHVIDCVIHPNPYPFYSELVSARPLYFDKALNAWVASSADIVREVFLHPKCAVRPLSKPIPDNLIGSKAGTIFQHLIRMNEGQKHAQTQTAMTKVMPHLPLDHISNIGHKWAETLLDKHSDNINQLGADLPVYVLADLLSVPSNLIGEVVALVQTFALCLNPLSTAEQVDSGKQAGADLFKLIQHELNSGFYTHLVETTSPDIAIANTIGLMFQSYEATAGLIGNALQTLALYDDLREQITDDKSLLSSFIQEVSRWNPSVQNTKRYLTADTVIVGQAMSTDESIILALAAANWDETVNSNPHQFRLHRENRQSFTFGIGHHACIGEAIAYNIVESALTHVLKSDRIQHIDTQATIYQQYGNLRIPVLVMTQENDE